MMDYHLDVNGFEFTAAYSVHEEAVLDSLIKRICSAPVSGTRKIVLLAGPPGAGKSTLALTLCQKTSGRMQALGLDGFHFPQKILNSTHIRTENGCVLLADIKGAPESFDAQKFLTVLTEMKTGAGNTWPVYDRNLHDVSGAQISVTTDTLIVEGNWVLLDSGIWREVRKYADVSVSVMADEFLLKERLIARKIRGGKTEAEARAWYDRVDGANVRRFQRESVPGDIAVFLREDGTLSFCKF